MPSLVYRLMEAVMWRTGVRDSHALVGDAVERAFEGAMGSEPLLPWEPDARFRSHCELEVVDIAGAPCYRLRRGGETFGGPCSKGAILYLNGGGFTHPAGKRDFKLAATLAKLTGREVWLLCYPLEPHSQIHEIVACVLAAYRRMLEDYAAGEVVLFGLSSGACLCLYLLVYVDREKTDDPYPARIVLNSPVVELPPNEAQLARMRELDEVDCVLPASYFGPEGTIGWMLRHEEPRYLYLSRVLEATMTDWPPMTVVFGTHETPYAYARDFAAALNAFGVPCDMREVAGCGHCTVLYQPAREARDLLRWEAAAIGSGAGLS